MMKQAITLQERIKCLRKYLEQPEWDPDLQRWATATGRRVSARRRRPAEPAAASDGRRRTASP